MRWFHKICTFYKNFKNRSPRYLYKLIPIKTTPHNTRLSNNLLLFHIRHNFFKDSLFLSAVIEWNNHLSIRNSEILSIFKKISCNLQSLLLATHTTALTLMESNILKAKSWFKSSLWPQIQTRFPWFT